MKISSYFLNIPLLGRLTITHATGVGKDTLAVPFFQRIVFPCGTKQYWVGRWSFTFEPKGWKPEYEPFDQKDRQSPSDSQAA